MTTLSRRVSADTWAVLLALVLALLVRFGVLNVVPW
jgi:heme A synthase